MGEIINNLDYTPLGNGAFGELTVNDKKVVDFTLNLCSNPKSSGKEIINGSIRFAELIDPADMGTVISPEKYDAFDFEEGGALAFVGLLTDKEVTIDLEGVVVRGGGHGNTIQFRCYTSGTGKIGDVKLVDFNGDDNNAGGSARFLGGYVGIARG